MSYLNSEVMRDSAEALETIEPISWTVLKRYSDFSALNKALRAEAGGGGGQVGADLVLPGKKMTGNLSEGYHCLKILKTLLRLISSLTSRLEQSMLYRVSRQARP